jgi:hypothetical protein
LTLDEIVYFDSLALRSCAYFVFHVFALLAKDQSLAQQFLSCETRQFTVCLCWRQLPYRDDPPAAGSEPDRMLLNLSMSPQTRAWRLVQHR